SRLPTARPQIHPAPAGAPDPPAIAAAASPPRHRASSAPPHGSATPRSPDGATTARAAAPAQPIAGAAPGAPPLIVRERPRGRRATRNERPPSGAVQLTEGLEGRHTGVLGDAGVPRAQDDAPHVEGHLHQLLRPSASLRPKP